MAAFQFKVTYVDGRTEIATVGPKAQVAYERHFKTSVAKFSEEAGAEKLYFLGWVALHYTGREPDDFDRFLDKVEDVGPTGEEEPTNPTNAAQ